MITITHSHKHWTDEGGHVNLNGEAVIGDGVTQGDQLLSGFELADDLLRVVADSFHGEVPCPFWPDENSHSP